MVERRLTQKEEAFCTSYVEIGEGGRAWARAYRKPYDTTSEKKNAHEMASKLRAKPAIAARIAELQAMAAEKTGVTVETISKQLDEDRDFARSTGNASAAVSASVAKGKLFGHFVEKKDITIGMRPDEARAVVASLLSKFADKLL